MVWDHKGGKNELAGDRGTEDEKEQGHGVVGIPAELSAALWCLRLEAGESGV